MIRRRAFHVLLSAAALTAILLAPAGCGEENEDSNASASQPSGEFRQVVRDLEEAALAGETYGAIRQARALSAPEEAAITGFCEMAWQLIVNQEVSKLSSRPYIEGRLASRSAIVLDGGAKPELEAATAALKRIVDLKSLDGTLTNGYKRACY